MPRLLNNPRPPSSSGHLKRHLTAPTDREPELAPLPLSADPGSAALIGTVLLFGLLGLPDSLIWVLVAAIVSAVAQVLRPAPKPGSDEDPRDGSRNLKEAS